MVVANAEAIGSVSGHRALPCIFFSCTTTTHPVINLEIWNFQSGLSCERANFGIDPLINRISRDAEMLCNLFHGHPGSFIFSPINALIKSNQVEQSKEANLSGGGLAGYG